jgi:hypothetical protein
MSRSVFTPLALKEPLWFKITKRKDWQQLQYLDGVKEKVFEYAKELAFGQLAELPKGIGSRGEIFIQLFLRKLAEFAVYKYFSKLGFSLLAPDLRLTDLVLSSHFDIALKGKRALIQWVPFYSNLLLLDRGGFDAEGFYQGENGSTNKPYDYFVLTRIMPDGLEIMKREKWLNAEAVDLIRLRDTFLKPFWELDIPGYLEAGQVQQLWKTQMVFPTEGTLNGKTKMGKDFIYCQAGELEPIDRLLAE